MKINLNDQATVILTDLGQDIYENYFRELGIKRKAPRKLTTELWDVAAIFGSHLHNGCQMPFKNTDLEIEKS